MNLQIKIEKKLEKIERQYTVSVILLTNEAPRRILLVYHKKIGMWVPPGGHHEKDENPVTTGIREVFEETGINIDSSFSNSVVRNSSFNILPKPDFFFEELIPHYKNEESHYHLDQVFVLNIPFQKLSAKNEEGDEVRWFSQKELETISLVENIRHIVPILFAE